MTYKNIHITSSIWWVDPYRNTLIKSTDSNNWKNSISFEERIFLSIKWKLDEIVSPKQVAWNYNYLSDKNEVELNWKKDIDFWAENEEKNIGNAIINNAKSTLRWLTWLWYTNYPDHISSEAEKIIFAYAMKTWIYSEEEINSIKFNHWEDKNFYIEKYWTNSQKELLLKLKELWERETEKLREYIKNNPEPKSYLWECSWTCC